MICSKCGKKANSELCFVCKPKKPLSSGKGLTKKSYFAKPKEKDIIETLKKATETDKLKQFFISLWNKRAHYSEVSNTFLGNSFSTIYQHHILSKSKYPELALKEDNIIFLTFQEHQQVEADIYRYEEINNRRKQLKIKYNIL